MPPFRYEAFVNPYIGSISELMGKGDQAKAEALLRIGEIQARAEEQRGQAWGNAVQGLGKIASEIPGQIQEQKDREFQTQQRERMVAGQAREDRARELSQKVSSTPDTQRIRYVNVPGQEAQPADWAQGKDEVFGTLPIRQSVPVISNAYKNLSENQIGSLNLWDISKIQQQYAQAGLGIEAQPYLKMYEDSNAGMVKHHESALATAREDASRLLQVGNYPAMMSQAKDLIPKYEANGVFSQRNLDAFKSQLASIEKMPEEQKLMALKQALMSISGEKPTLMNLGVSDRVVVVQTGEVKGEGASPPVAPRRSITNAEIEMLIAQGDPIALAVKGNRAEIAKALQDGLDKRARIAAAATSGAGAATGPNSIASTVFNNPLMFKELTPTLRAQIIPTLAGMGFNFNALSVGQTGVATLEAALPQLQAMDGSLTQKSGLPGVIEGAAQMGLSKLGMDPIAKTYAAVASPLAISLSRASGEVGNLALQEQTKWEPIVPTGFDPYPIRQAKYAAIAAFIGIAKSGSTGGNMSATEIAARNKKAADVLYATLLEITKQVPKQSSNPFPEKD